MRYFKLFTWAFLAGSFALSGTALRAQNASWGARDVQNNRQNQHHDRRDFHHDGRRADKLRDTGANRYGFKQEMRDSRRDSRDNYRGGRDHRNNSRNYWTDR
jgi:hypothetical protein